MRRWRLLVIETTALGGAAFVAVIAALGQAAARFTGGETWASLLPFTLSVLALALCLGVVGLGWLGVRRRLRPRRAWLPASLAVALAAGSIAYATRPAFEADVATLRALLGARRQAERDTISHQVFAMYRRTAPPVWTALLERTRRYEGIVREAAAAFEVDAEVLMGIAAVESSFRPRTAGDGGRGLFQITAAPADAVAQAGRALGVADVDVERHRDNAFVAAATLRAYLEAMDGDLFLALLAYNIGPRNGGLLSIMQRYGARDFVTIQPYLQHLPRDYPVRVLSAALAYRLWRREGAVPRYEEGDNAVRIQRIGVPGL